MNILIPIEIDGSMIGAATSVAEPASGETVWTSGSNYVLGDFRILTTTHRVYECVQAHTGRSTSPKDDAAYWLDKGPTQRFAPFDYYTSTAATGLTTMTFVLTPGYFNSLALYGLTGNGLAVTIKDAPGGSTIYSNSVDLTEPPAGWYEYLFSGRKAINKVILKDLPIRPAAELTLTITAGSGAPVGVGMINVGDYTSLIGDGAWGGTKPGATVEPITNSYIKLESDGTALIKRRASATGMRASIGMPRDQADAALYKIQSVLDVPVSFIDSDLQGFSGLNVFGLGSATVSYDGFYEATLNLTVKGFI